MKKIALALLALIAIGVAAEAYAQGCRTVTCRPGIGGYGQVCTCS